MLRLLKKKRKKKKKTHKKGCFHRQSRFGRRWIKRSASKIPLSVFGWSFWSGKSRNSQPAEAIIGLEFWRPPCNRPPHQTIMGHLSFTLTVTLTTVSLLLIIFSGKWTHVSGSLKIKTHEGTIYQYERKVMCDYTPWRLDSLLYSACVKKRKRFLADENILQSPEKARSFLGKSTRGYRTNYALFWEECCLEGCNTEEILEHCVVAYK